MPSYMNRAMQSRDPRFVRVLEKLGHKRETPTAKVKKATKPEVPPADLKPDDEFLQLRAEYERVTGKRPWHGWDAAELRSRIADATADAAAAKPASDAED